MRVRNHAQLGSVRKHNEAVHNKKTLGKQDIVKCTTILKYMSTKHELIITEALLITNGKLHRMHNVKEKYEFWQFFDVAMLQFSYSYGNTLHSCRAKCAIPPLIFCFSYVCAIIWCWFPVCCRSKTIVIFACLCVHLRRLRVQ